MSGALEAEDTNISFLSELFSLVKQRGSRNKNLFQIILSKIGDSSGFESLK